MAVRGFIHGARMGGRMATGRAARAYDAGYVAIYRTGVRFSDTAEATTAFVRFVDRTRPRGRALELGCGEGRDAIFLAKRGLDVVAIDASAAALSRARERARQEGVRVRFSLGNMTGRQPFGDASFDLVTCIDAFHYAIEARDRIRHFREAYRVLKPGGLYFFCNHTARWPRTSPGEGTETIIVEAPAGAREIRIPRVPYAVLTKAGYARAVRGAGFVIRMARHTRTFPIRDEVALIVGEKPPRRRQGQTPA